MAEQENTPISPENPSSAPYMPAQPQMAPIGGDPASPQQPQQPQQATWQQPQQPAMPDYQYAQAAPVAATPATQGSGKATGALICGILAILASPTVLLGIILGIVAVVLAILSKKQSRSGQATAGLICGIIGAVLSILLVVAGVAIVGQVMNDPEFQAAIEDLDTGDGTETSGTDTTNGSPGTDGTDDGTSNSAVPVADRLAGTVIADDDVCTIKLESMEIAESSGDLRVFYTITNNCEADIIFESDPVSRWDINGNEALCVCYNIVEPSETKEDYCYVPADYVPEGGIDSITSLSGTMVVEMPWGDQLPYYLNF